MVEHLTFYGNESGSSPDALVMNRNIQCLEINKRNIPQLCMILTIVNIFHVNWLLFDSYSLNLIFDEMPYRICDLMEWRELWPAQGYQLVFFNDELPLNGQVITLVVNRPHVEQYWGSLLNYEFIHTTVDSLTLFYKQLPAGIY